MNPGTELSCPTFEKSCSRGQLPASDSFAKRPFQDRSGQDGPQNGQPDLGAGQACGQQIARSNARRGK